MARQRAVIISRLVISRRLPEPSIYFQSGFPYFFSGEILSTLLYVSMWWRWEGDWTDTNESTMGSGRRSGEFFTRQYDLIWWIANPRPHYHRWIKKMGSANGTFRQAFANLSINNGNYYRKELEKAQKRSKANSLNVSTKTEPTSNKTDYNEASSPSSKSSGWHPNLT